MWNTIKMSDERKLGRESGSGGTKTFFLPFIGELKSDSAMT